MRFVLTTPITLPNYTLQETSSSDKEDTTTVKVLSRKNSRKKSRGDTEVWVMIDSEGNSKEYKPGSDSDGSMKDIKIAVTAHKENDRSVMSYCDVFFLMLCVQKEHLLYQCKMTKYVNWI